LINVGISLELDGDGGEGVQGAHVGVPLSFLIMY
jgi:hypothetical protein